MKVSKSEWKVHALALVMVIIAERIGQKSFMIGPGKAVFLPMLYALVIGMFLPKLKLVKTEDMETASPFIGLSVMFLSAKMGLSIGPNLAKLVAAGPALILQEFGMLGTILFAMPVAVLILRMGRECIGASFSNSREGSLALVSDLYGLESKEGQGVMGAYIVGTLLGAIYSGLLAGFVVSLNIFHPYALAMATGTGSASMMAASMGPVVSAYPDMRQSIEAYAAASQLLTSVDGVWSNLFLAIPLTEFLYRALWRMRGRDVRGERQPKQPPKGVSA